MKNYILLFLSVMLLSACSQNKANDDKSAEPKAVVPHYELAAIKKAGVSTTIKLPAQLSAFEEVSIFPKINGYVKTVLVDVGSKVKKGNLLMVLEAPELIQAMLQAKERYARSKSDLSIDKEHYMRLLEASNTAGAVSPLDLSTARSKVQSDSALCNAEKANWQMQQTMMDYLKVTAPFDGIITERNVHPGALVSSSAKDKPMLELKEVNHLRLQVDIPEAIATELKDKDTISFYTSAHPGKKMTGYISRKSDNVNTEMRSERMEIDVWNKNNILSPGMYADVIIYSKGNAEAFAVPRSAVITSTERKYIIVVRNGKAVKTDVITGNQSIDKIELYGTFQPGDKVIVNPSDEIKNGSNI